MLVSTRGTAGASRDVSDSGWANLTVDMGSLASATGNIDRFNTDAGVLNTSTAYQLLQRSYNLLSYGNNTPDLILMSMTPYEDYDIATANKVTFDKGTVGASGCCELPVRDPQVPQGCDCDLGGRNNLNRRRSGHIRCHGGRRDDLHPQHENVGHVGRRDG